MPLHQIFYVSRSLALPGQVSDILLVARVRNAQAGITGALLCTGGFFAQVLEGPREALQRTMACIDADARHADVTRLLQAGLDARRFADWSMAFTERPGADDLVEHLVGLQPVEPSRALRLVQLMFSGVAAAPAQPSSKGARNS
ncbi:blue light sensor protein [Xylophilus rhododendri]|uniref:Blue light sensor protein n=1 Tax=Xylophilus rhododendri TaxID=2697032 RepID=A0A857J034_9BURK|nr:BLUF domain-containing protein [Xylophilus rhododendri]QHI97224.1 blue light sensor protein [Xylophilus rhododendri]